MCVCYQHAWSGRMSAEVVADKDELLLITPPPPSLTRPSPEPKSLTIRKLIYLMNLHIFLYPGSTSISFAEAADLRLAKRRSTCLHFVVGVCLCVCVSSVTILSPALFRSLHVFYTYIRAT